MKRRTHNRGFTLTEILVALAIFALGGTAIMALFITNLRLSQQAMDYTRAAEISRNVRSLMAKSLTRPIHRGRGANLHEFYYPGSSLTFVPDDYLTEYEAGDSAGQAPSEADLGGGYRDASIFYELPTEAFDATDADAASDTIVHLPRSARNSSGVPRTIDGDEPDVFRLLPNDLRRVGALDGLDPDDRMFYQFDLSVRRSVQRSSVEDPLNPGTTLPLRDLYVVHIRIYKGYDFEVEDAVQPYYEWDFNVSAAR